MGNGKLQKQGEYTKIVIYYHVFYAVIELLSDDMSNPVQIGHLFKQLLISSRTCTGPVGPAWRPTACILTLNFGELVPDFFDQVHFRAIFNNYWMRFL